LGLNEYILFLETVYSFIVGGAVKLRWAGWGAKRPDGHGNEPKKTGARSARARTRGQNPLVHNTHFTTEAMKYNVPQGPNHPPRPSHGSFADSYSE